MLNYGRYEKPEVRQNGGRNFDVLQSTQFLNFHVSGRLRVVTEVLWYHFWCDLYNWKWAKSKVKVL